MRIAYIIIFLTLCNLGTALQISAGPVGMETFIPAPDCAEGWRMDGNVSLFDKDTLFDRINGESELYFPYGFEMLAYARYENRQNPAIAIDADVYKMGSLLDAFGMFANYRKKHDDDIAIGGGGTVSESQLFFYQDRYFVRLQVTGATSITRKPFTACARTIAKNLPQNSDRPIELEALNVTGVMSKSVRYVAQSLLGYEFFKRGLIADTLLNNEQAQIFIVLVNTQEVARETIEKYRVYLVSSGSTVSFHDEKKRVLLEAKDPLYGTVIAEQAGKFVIGIIRVGDVDAAKQLAGQVLDRISGR
jgi:hypothetical protein